MRNGPKKLTAALINLCLLLPTVAVFITVIAAPIASAQDSCGESPNNIPTISQYFEEHSVEDAGWGMWWDGGSEDLRSLDVGFSTEMEIENDSANAISMELVPGYRYTFCITLVADSVSPPSMGAIGDFYLMTESNWNRYSGSYADRESRNLEEVVDTIPVEWRDMFVWLPFRDVHFYEGVSSEVFSVAIDSSGSMWSSVDWFDSGDARYYLVVDGWDNGRDTDRGAAGGTMQVEILVNVEERTTLPSFIAYILIAALPLACIIAPLIIHSRYMDAGLGDTEEAPRHVPYLEDESDERDGAD